MIDKQRKLGHRTFSLPDELDLVPAPATPLRKRILRAGKVDRIDLEPDLRSVKSDQPAVKRKKVAVSPELSRYNTMEVLQASEKQVPNTNQFTVMNPTAKDMRRHAYVTKAYSDVTKGNDDVTRTESVATPTKQNKSFVDAEVRSESGIPSSENILQFSFEGVSS